MKRRIVLSRPERARLEEEAAGCTDGPLRTRLLIIIHSHDGWRRPAIARALRCDLGTVSRVRARWLAAGRQGLTDGRAFNGKTKADTDYAATVRWMLGYTPIDFCHRRPTWTQRLLIQTARQYTGVAVSTTTMGRVLKRLRARLGRPKPAAPCPWSQKARKARMRMIHQLVKTLPRDEVCYWEDEVDIDLNPKIGRDWMLPGTQRRVMTPGKNVKRYAALAMNARTGGLRLGHRPAEELGPVHRPAGASAPQAARGPQDPPESWTTTASTPAGSHGPFCSATRASNSTSSRPTAPTTTASSGRCAANCTPTSRSTTPTPTSTTSWTRPTPTSQDGTGGQWQNHAGLFRTFAFWC